MSFQPVIPLPGLGGWAFLSRTLERQQASFNDSPMLQRDTAYFREKIATVTSADALVNDRRLLRVALGAFGLQSDIDNRAFIRQILEGGADDRSALANRLADKRYLAFAQGFAHLRKGDDAPAIPSSFADRIIRQYEGREFEVAVGNQDDTMRLALALQRDLPELAQTYRTDTSRWYALLGNPPLRKIMETSLGLPKEFGLLDIDEQRTRMSAAMQRRFGVSDLEQISQPDVLDKLTRRFLVMSQLREMQAEFSSSGIALVLLQTARR